MASIGKKFSQMNENFLIKCKIRIEKVKDFSIKTKYYSIESLNDI